VIELRRYELFGNNSEALYDRFAQHTTRIFARHGFDQIGYFRTVIGDGPDLIYLLRWSSLDDRQRGWTAFHADPEWKEVRRATTQAHGLLVARTSSSILEALPFSALQ
jgi:hypothetical protein